MTVRDTAAGRSRPHPRQGVHAALAWRVGLFIQRGSACVVIPQMHRVSLLAWRMTHLVTLPDAPGAFLPGLPFCQEVARRFRSV